MSNNTRQSWPHKLNAGLLGVSLLFVASTPHVEANVNIANSPLFLTSSVDPNIMFILDDSGSMHYEITPDDYRAVGRTNGDARFVFPRAASVYGGNDYANTVATVDDNTAYNALTRSPQVNTTYYNPSITYTPWAKHDGSLYPPASISCAPHNPENMGSCPSGSTVVNAYARNLTVNNSNYNSPSWRTCTSATSCSSTTNSKTFWPATYFWHNGGNVWSWSNYTKVEIRSTTPDYSGHGRDKRSDCASGVCTYAQEMQNFANWYTYYRSRVLAARAGIGRAFAQQGENLRVGFGAINKSSSSIDNVSTSTIVRGVRPFTGSNREDFFTELYGRTIPNAATPLRGALDDAGKYFSRADNRGPWGAQPGSNNSSPHLECRQSFTILMTDGYYSDGVSSVTGNIDNSNGPVITAPDGSTYQYIPADPYKDGHSGTLADIAMYYWSRDLRSDLPNAVPTTAQNEAFWQHMVTFGVAFGVTGSVNESDAWAAVESGNPINWPNPDGGNPPKLDDLLHAGINSRGGFFSAQDPDTFANELAKTLELIVARVETSGTAAATSSAVLQTDTLLYTASFRSTDWSGTIVAREVNADGTVGGAKWNAEQKMDAMDPDDRKVYTLKDDGTKIELLWGSLGSSQKDALNLDLSGGADGLGEHRIAWLRGVEHDDLRDRQADGIIRRIGDLVGSDPQFMFKRDFGYSLLPGPEGSSYATFRSTTPYTSRADVLFVGSNGGMLHAFHAGTPLTGSPPAMHPNGGAELFAYVPSELLAPGTSAHAPINELMDPNYSHRFYVDGTAAVGDAYLGGSWKTILVGTMGAGGRTVFALDVTNPTSFGASNVLWEFTHSELGYGVSQPTIARLPDGTWVAIFGNGYNSASQRAMLFVVELETGGLRHLIDTGVGTAGSPNGLAAPIVTDWPTASLSASRIYAGDLYGNVWRFALGSSPSAAKVFTATDSTGDPQPITARPSIAQLPGDSQQVVVTFGTGSFFRTEDGDMSSPQAQTLYGVFDSASGVTNVVRSDLLAQTIETNGAPVTIDARTYPAGSLRRVTGNDLTTQKGWRVDLPVSGERVISEPTFPSGAVQTRVRFSTLIPDDDPCGGGRAGFLMDIDLSSGGRYTAPVFDLSGDGRFSEDDLWDDEVVSGITGLTGERVTVIRNPDSELDYMYAGDGNPLDGDCEGADCEPVGGLNTSGPVGRQSWRQLR